MKLSGETKLLLGIGLTTVLLIVGAIFFFSRQEQTQQNILNLSREELIPVNSSTKGNASASAFLVEFSDFQCPACATYKPIVDQVINDYQDKVLFTYRHYPLPQHPFSEKAARAAEAAATQGKFWEMYDELFARQDTLSDDTILEAAIKIGIDESVFIPLLNDPKVIDKVNKDRNDGNRFGVNATPTFYLNGNKVSFRSSDELKSLIDSISDN